MIKVENLEQELEQSKAQIESLRNETHQTISNNESNQEQTELINSLQSQINNLNVLIQSEKDSNLNLKQSLDATQSECDRLQLELKQQQQIAQQEKILQYHQENTQLEHFKTENKDLKLKLDEKIKEVNLLGEQISELNQNINDLKSNDSSLFNELKQSTERFVQQLDDANHELADLRAQNEALKQNNAHGAELESLREQYNQVYSYLEQKNLESLNYYNEIQRLNVIVSELNKELQNSKTINENLTEQCDTLLRELDLQQKMVEELNQQTSELNKTINVAVQQQLEQDSCLSITDSGVAGASSIDSNELQQEILNLKLQLEEAKLNHESDLKAQMDKFALSLEQEEKQKQKMSKELQRLKEHLVEMSDNYNKEALIAEEREKQLRLDLNQAQNLLQQQGANLDTTK